MALDVLIELEMIELTEDKVYKVKNFAKHQNIKVKENTETIKNEEEINKKDAYKFQKISETIYPKEEINLPDNVEGNHEDNEKIAQIDELKKESKISADKNNDDGTKIKDTTLSQNAIKDDNLTVLDINKKKQRNMKEDSIDIKDDDVDEDESICTFIEGEYVIPKDQRIIKSWTFS